MHLGHTIWAGWWEKHRFIICTLSNKNNIYYFILVGVLLTMFNSDYVTPLERARRLKAAQKETKVAKTISIPISYWALLDEIKTKLGKKNANETLLYCIEQIGVELELET